MKKVSVIVPVYNVERYLEKCLNSLVNQTLSDIEIILINDGSTDSSLEIIEKFYNNHSDKIKYYTTSNKGQAAARNYAYKYATGEYITYVDSDDWIDTNMLETMYNIASLENLDIIISNIEMLNSSNESLGIIPKIECESDVHRYLVNESGPCAKLYRKEMLDKINFKFPESIIYEDLAIIPSLILYTSKIKFIDNAFYKYLIRDGSTMKQKKYSDKLNDIFLSVNNLLDIFKSEKKFNMFKDELEWLYIEHLLHSASLRLLPFSEGKKDIYKIVDNIRLNFPKYYKNKYYKSQSIKYKIVCNLIFFKQLKILKMLLRIN